MCLNKIPLLVIPRNIPMHLYSNTCISYIASAIGKPLYMDKGTTNLTHLDFARICVEVDAGGEIEKVINVDIGEEEFVKVEVIIPWCPEKCVKCSQFGHNCEQRSNAEMQVEPEAVQTKEDDETTSSKLSTTHGLSNQSSPVDPISQLNTREVPTSEEPTSSREPKTTTSSLKEDLNQTTVHPEDKSAGNKTGDKKEVIKLEVSLPLYNTERDEVPQAEEHITLATESS